MTGVTRTIALLVFACGLPCAVGAQQAVGLGDAQIAQMIVRDSRAAYHATGHPCACPDDHMRNGRQCGGRSAYSRPGGASPKCYPRDVSAAEIAAYRSQQRP